MNTAQINLSARENSASKPSRSKSKSRVLALALVLGAISFALGGCVSDGYVGVSSSPDYSPYYGYYGYSGAPYAGYGGIYSRRLVVGGRRYSSGYGRHHFVRDRRGGYHRSFSRSSNRARAHFGTRGRR